MIADARTYTNFAERNFISFRIISKKYHQLKLAAKNLAVSAGNFAAAS